MTDEHLHCPQCGYDVFGLDRPRCPECGFHFTKEALRELLHAAEAVRIEAAQTIIIQSIWAGGLSLLAVANALGVSGGWLLVIAIAVFIPGYWVSAVMSDFYAGPASLPALMWVFVGLVLLGPMMIVIMLGLIPWLWLPIAVLIVAGWMTRLWRWRRLPRAAEDGTGDGFRAYIDRMSAWATGALIGATVLAFAAVLV